MKSFFDLRRRSDIFGDVQKKYDFVPKMRTKNIFIIQKKNFHTIEKFKISPFKQYMI